MGIYDRDNFSYAGTLLQNNGLLIGVDVEPQPEQDNLVRETIRSTKKYCFIHVNSTSSTTLETLNETLGNKKLDAVFIDGGHDAQTVLADFANYIKFVRKGGFIFFHDAPFGWENNKSKVLLMHLKLLIALTQYIWLMETTHLTRFIPNLTRSGIFFLGGGNRDTFCGS